MKSPVEGIPEEPGYEWYEEVRHIVEMKSGVPSWGLVAEAHPSPILSSCYLQRKAASIQLFHKCGGVSSHRTCLDLSHSTCLESFAIAYFHLFV